MDIKKLLIFLFLFTFLGCASIRPFGIPSFSSRQKYVQTNSRLPGSIRQAILEGQVVEGMTKEQVMATWGKPSVAEKSSNGPYAWRYDKDGEDWWYKNFFGSTHFIKFNSGKVTRASSYFK